MFSQFSETSFDLANDLMQCDLWDPKSLPAPLHDEVPKSKRLDDNIPFGLALPAAVHLPPETKGEQSGKSVMIASNSLKKKD